MTAGTNPETLPTIASSNRSRSSRIHRNRIANHE